MKCSSCSAPLLQGKPKCAYCGCMNDIDLQGKHYFTTHTPEKPRLCCRCKVAMTTINLQSAESPFLIERCDHCMALFFDPGELDSLIDHQVRAVFSIDALALQEMVNQARLDSVVYRNCPVCNGQMNRVNFGKSSGVIVDQCIEHGMYLDAGELQRILLWVRKGGRLSSEVATDPPLKEHYPRKPASQTILPSTGSEFPTTDTERMVGKVLDFVSLLLDIRH